MRTDETELIYNPGIVGWQSGAKLTHAPLCQHNCLDQQTQIHLQIQIQKNTNTNSYALPHANTIALINKYKLRSELKYRDDKQEVQSE